jgi:hypothetical protein
MDITDADQVAHAMDAGGSSNELIIQDTYLRIDTRGISPWCTSTGAQQQGRKKNYRDRVHWQGEGGN